MANHTNLLIYLRAGGILSLIESTLVVATVWFTFIRSRSAETRDPGFRAVEAFFSRLAHRKTAAIITCGIAVLVIRIGLIPVLGIPQPTWHDEFSLLLAGDTFAHGRLTNPTHPMWQHFESFHIIEKPTYMSMYPPGGGLVLALGQKLGHPWIGQLICAALMCAAFCWMLQAWVPPGWALYGGFLAVLRLGTLSYWANTYFCGSLPALGGALVLGALPRLQRGARLRDALWMAIGLVTLANSRPYEGFVFSLPVAAFMLWWLATEHRFTFATLFRRVVVPVTLVLSLAAAGMSYYFWRVTGDPFRMPYQVNRETYAAAPYFVWQHPRPIPVYRHAVMYSFYVGWELMDFEAGRTFTGFLARCRHKAIVLWMFYLGPLLTLGFLGFPRAVRDRRMRFPVILAAVFLVGLLLETWTGSHYAAPGACLLYLFLAQSFRHLRWWQWRQLPLGLALVRAIPLVAITMIALRVTAVLAHVQIEPAWARGNLERAAVVKELRQLPAKSLVIVHYSENHPSNVEWVYNAASIDAAKIVWAHDMGRAANEELIHYFRDRQVWLLEADASPPTLARYGSQPNSQPAALPVSTSGPSLKDGRLSGSQ
ncbi:MAG TPA: hypothetical protein VFJ47_15165 [Terriglobales bacterium]|nr:hypothetical protein [Terriglobales bacterium]